MRQMNSDCLLHRGIYIVIACILAEHHIHLEGSSGDFENGHIAKEVRKLVCIQRS